MAVNTNDTKHYLTIMPIVSADGGLMLHLFFQIAQPQGRFQPTINVFTEPIFFTVAGTTNVMKINSCLKFLQKCVKPYLQIAHYFCWIRGLVLEVKELIIY